MSKLPFYKSFKNFWINQFSQIRQAWENKELVWILFYIFAILILIMPGIGYFVGGVDNLITTSRKYIPIIFEAEYPPKKLSYELIKRNKTEEGLHRTLFKISIESYPGDKRNQTLYGINLGQDAECERGSDKFEAKILAGIATSTQEFLFDCLTKEPLLDNGKLFSIFE